MTRFDYEWLSRALVMLYGRGTDPAFAEAPAGAAVSPTGVHVLSGL